MEGEVIRIVDRLDWPYRTRDRRRSKCGKGDRRSSGVGGAFVYVNDLHEDRAAEVVAAIKSNGNSASAAIFDVTDASAFDAGFDAISVD